MIAFRMSRWLTRGGGIRLGAAVLVAGLSLAWCTAVSGQQEHTSDAASTRSKTVAADAIPELVDITAKTGIHFTHLSSPNKKYIVESMSGGVALIDYDRDGWPDIFFTNAPDVDMSSGGNEGAQRAVSQQPRWHLYRCDGQGWCGTSVLGYGRGGGRFQ